MESLTLLKFAVYNAYGLSLGPSENQNQAFNFFRNYNIGDLIMEVSTAYYDHMDKHRFGTLISKNMEPMFSDEKWESVKEGWDNERPEELVHRIKLLNTDEEFAWTNANFIKVPINIKIYGFDS